MQEGDYGRELQIPIVILGELQRVLYEYGETELATKMEKMYEKHSTSFQNRGGFNKSDF